MDEFRWWRAKKGYAPSLRRCEGGCYAMIVVEKLRYYNGKWMCALCIHERENNASSEDN